MMKTLTKEELAEFRTKLLTLRARLRGDVATLADAALNDNRSELSGVPLHMADVGSDNFEQESTLSFMESGANSLAQVEAALNRMDEGTYGICEQCEGKIAKARLNAIPYVAQCIKCASESS
ncbi:MAG: TraR/DksA family transcriptional regulator [Thermoguttaceae bacterium]